MVQKMDKTNSHNVKLIDSSRNQSKENSFDYEGYVFDSPSSLFSREAVPFEANRGQAYYANNDISNGLLWRSTGEDRAIFDENFSNTSIYTSDLESKSKKSKSNLFETSEIACLRPNTVPNLPVSSSKESTTLNEDTDLFDNNTQNYEKSIFKNTSSNFQFNSLPNTSISKRRYTSHAMSEQRRRMMMTHCFKRIDNLIPDNGMKRKSKASILEATVYYLENIQRSEAHLKRQIAHLHAENVAMSEKIRKCVERDPSVSPIIMERMREIVQKHLNTLNHKAKKDFAPIAPAPQGGAAFIGTIIN